MARLPARNIPGALSTISPMMFLSNEMIAYDLCEKKKALEN